MTNTNETNPESIKTGDKVTYAEPLDDVERNFIGVVIGCFPDSQPPRATIWWINSNMAIAPVITSAITDWKRV